MARTLDLKGLVKNLPDGRVLVVAEGEEADLGRFCRAIKIEDPLIKVDEIVAKYSEPKGAWDDFYKIAGESETDSRLDTATVFLKELIVVVKDGFKETNSRLSSVDEKLGSIDSKLDTVATKLDRIVDTQEKIVHKIDAARREIVFEVKGLRHDLKGRMGGSLQRKRELIDIAQIRAKMNLRAT
jgi:acylphosphatase